MKNYLGILFACFVLFACSPKAERQSIENQEKSPTETEVNPPTKVVESVVEAEPTNTQPQEIVIKQGILEIIYIDNDCFIFQTADHKILIDPHADFMYETKLDIAAGEAPFDNLDLLLITHIHADHFDAGLTADLLDANPGLIMVSPQDVQDSVAIKNSDLLEKGQMFAFEPVRYEREVFSIPGISLEMLYLQFGDPVTNLGYVISVDGWKVFHSGDTMDIDDLIAYNLAADELDVAMLSYHMFTLPQYIDAGDRSTPVVVPANTYIPMHYSKRHMRYSQTMEQLKENFPEGVLFENMFDSIVLEPEDY